ncbi:MAG TPA: phosphate ABC transporter permease PstA [Solirubrobacteraceae bacterium]|jgi:phosphate transport system permease protein|nr:phosphate ABC transporter permease PstA [Solirubrobacteraceae bacterium]
MASPATTSAPPNLLVVRPKRQGTASWPLIDRLGYWLCWTMGIALCLIAIAIVIFMLVKGISYLKPSLFVESPVASVQQRTSGGFFDPIVGTLIITAIGTSIAAPIGVALAAWLSEYARPAPLARAVESGIDVIAGVPSIVLAIFGLLVFTQSFLGFLSQHAANGAVYGRSFFAAGIVMSILALPLIVGSTREALAQVPDRMREASYALGKTRASTIRSVLLPAIRPDIASGVVLGMGRIIGDTAIITVLLGATLTNQGVRNAPVIGALRGTGSTLTSYVYYNSPAGEGNSPQKAYAAAFVLLLIVLALNMLVTRLSRGRDERGPLSILLAQLGTWGYRMTRMRRA